MQRVDIGSGPPIVVVPGIQGRWEWMKPGIDALAASSRVITFSLADEPTCAGTFAVATGFDCYVEQIREAMDQAEIDTAAICGVSYGGLIAAAFAARYPSRVRSLVLISAVSPSWTPDRRVRFYLRAPRLLMPLFMVTSLRMYREIATVHDNRWRGAREAVRHASNVLTHMFSPARMARRVRLLDGLDLSGVARVHVPTLIVTGDATLDRVVPVSSTHEYLRLFPHACVATVDRTGHLGFITRPETMAGIIVPFVSETASETASRRRIG